MKGTDSLYKREWNVGSFLAMMSLEKDTRVMANNLESDGVELATPRVATECGLMDRAIVDDKDVKINEFYGGRSTVGPPPTLMGNGGAHGGGANDQNGAWTAGYSLPRQEESPQDGGRFNGDRFSYIYLR